MYSISNNYRQQKDKNKVINLKQKKPSACSYVSGPLVSGAQNCRSSNKDIKSIIIQAFLQHLLFTRCDHFLTFSLHVLVSMLGSRSATGTND